MTPSLVAALVAGSVAVLFAGVMVFARSLYVSAVSLLVVLLQTAILFMLNGAPLLGLLQVMIYAGAVMVLVVITVMASGGASGPRFADFSIPRPVAVAGLVACAVQIAASARLTGLPDGAIDPALSAQLGVVLFKPYVLATETVTVLMFLASLAIAPRPSGEESP